jgi:predicted enzyme related to lactoylglutathione lyase
MLADSPAYSGFSVNDSGKAYDFYKNILGLRVESLEMGDILRVTLGSGAEVIIYPKPNHEPATYTIMNFPVSNIDAMVDILASKGVAFMHFNDPMIKTDAKGICRGDGVHSPTIAWFKDPAGNVLSLIEEDQ